MRVSERQRYDTIADRVERAKGNHTGMLEQLSTQKRINRVSDDPIGLAQAIRVKGRIADMSQFQKNIDFSKGYLESAETALSIINDNLLRARDLAVQMANSTYGSESREAAGREIKEIVTEVISRANTSYGKRFVFSGFRTETPTLNPDGVFLGDDGAVFLQVSNDVPRQINLQARGLFEALPEERQFGHMNMVDSLNTLYEAMMDSDQDSIRRCMSELDHQMEKVQTSRAQLGARFNGIDHSGQQIEVDKDLSSNDLSRLEDADFYKISSDFKRTEAVLQSTMMASNKILQPSLLNFLQ
jgi:flagellar hook-associated protein 3 FlgL